MDLDREVGAVEVLSGPCTVWVTRSRASATAPRSSALTSRPGISPNHCDQGGVEFGEQGGAELLDGIQRSAVEQTVDRIVAGAKFRAEAGTALRQRVDVALPPQLSQQRRRCLARW